MHNQKHLEKELPILQPMLSFFYLYNEIINVNSK